MTREIELINITRDLIQWDWDYNTNLLVLGLNNFPMKLPVHAGDQTDIATFFPPGRWFHCILLVDDTVNGQSIYLSDGTSWTRLVALSTAITPSAQTYETPRLVEIPNGDINFNIIMSDNNFVLGKTNFPFKLPTHAGDETDLETLLPAVEWDNCCILVYNTTLGASLYTSDATIWKRQF